MIPIPPQLAAAAVKVLIVVVLAASLYGLGQWHGRESKQMEWDAAVSKQQMAAGENMIKNAQNTAAIESQYQKTIDAQAQRVRQLTREVKHYAHGSSPKCALSPEFVTVFDGASQLFGSAADRVSPAADSPGAAAVLPEAAVTDVEVLEVHQLSAVELADLWDTYAALRDWVRSSHAIAQEGAGR